MSIPHPDWHPKQVAGRRLRLTRSPPSSVGLSACPSVSRLPSPLGWARPYRPSGSGLRLPPDHIDQIAAATAVACTDRSTSRWKQNQRAKKQEEALQRKLQPRLTNLMS